MAVQLACAAGLIFLVPLGDRMTRRKLLALLLLINAFALLRAAAQSLTQLLLLNVAIGMTSVGAQIVIPLVALIAPAGQRGRATGTVISGLMAGVLLGRILSGLVGEHGGWRAMYLLAALLDVVLMLMVPKLLPYNQPAASPLPYPTLLRTLAGYLRREPELRRASLCGALTFGAFSALWGALAFLLAQPPYGYGSDAVGGFGCAGLAGILVTPAIGRLSDRYTPRAVVLAGGLFAAAGYLSIRFSPHCLVALIAGVILLDSAGRAGLVGNQLSALALSDDARSRLNTVFMRAYFPGGAIGTRLGASPGARYGWTGIGLFGIVSSCCVLLLRARRTTPVRRP